MIVAEPSLQLLEKALRSGARDVVAPDAPNAELRRAFDQALDAADRRRRLCCTGRMQAAEPPRDVRLAPKGGTGKTTVSTNLASGLALEAPGEVVIVDLDFQFGDVASALRMTPEHTFADIVAHRRAVDVTTIKVFLTPSDTGLFALCAPGVAGRGRPDHAEMVQHVISLLSVGVPVRDHRHRLRDSTRARSPCSSSAPTSCVVTSTDVPSVRATRKEVEMLDLLGLKDQQRHFVVNRADARVGLPVSEVEATVGLPAAVTIPSSRAVPISVNQGTPVLVSDRRSNVGEAMLAAHGPLRADRERGARVPPAHARAEDQGGRAREPQ